MTIVEIGIFVEVIDNSYVQKDENDEDVNVNVVVVVIITLVLLEVD